MNEMLQDIWFGLHGQPRSIPSKYFYDGVGDAIFQEIMACPEYYLTRCELEIFTRQSPAIASAVKRLIPDFDVVELGAGDATKSVFLLRELMTGATCFTYHPIDFSANVISDLETRLPAQVPGMEVRGWNGDYFAMLRSMSSAYPRPRLVLFLGSNIGNVPLSETVAFFRQLRTELKAGDLLLTGFDLKKDPQVILAAYNDAAGITRRFNENLLARINRELDGDFVLSQFAHQPVYDETTGACESYLVSKADQDVCIGARGTVSFKKGEKIFTEVSQKYSVAQTDNFAAESGFAVVQHYTDEKGWFLDALWRAE